jgi:hypothetical protein
MAIFFSARTPYPRHLDRSRISKENVRMKAKEDLLTLNEAADTLAINKKLQKNRNMENETKDTGIPPAVMADMQAVAHALTSGKALDPEIGRRIRKRAAKARQELLASHGVQDIGVQIIREIRGDLPEL